MVAAGNTTTATPPKTAKINAKTIPPAPGDCACVTGMNANVNAGTRIIATAMAKAYTTAGAAGSGKLLNPRMMNCGTYATSSDFTYMSRCFLSSGGADGAGQGSPEERARDVVARREQEGVSAADETEHDYRDE